MIKLQQLRADLGRLASNFQASIRSLQLDIDSMEGGGEATAAPAESTDAESKPPLTLEQRVTELEKKHSLLEDGVRIALGRLTEWIQGQFALLVFAPGVQRVDAPSVDLQMDPEAQSNLEAVRAARVAGRAAQADQALERAENAQVAEDWSAVDGDGLEDAETEEPGQFHGAASDPEAQANLDAVRAARVANRAAQPSSETHEPEAPEASPTDVEKNGPSTPRDGLPQAAAGEPPSDV